MMTKERGWAIREMVAIASRLFLILVVALFAAHHVGAERNTTHTGPISAVETAFSSAILTAHNHIKRAPVPECDTPPVTVTGAEIATPQPALAWVVREPGASVSNTALTILPPVRGPPAV